MGQTPPWSLADFRVFGSPTYVLRQELQEGASLNKWKPRSWLGVYIGTSNCHASAIPLIYNPISTHISPQYHVVYDEFFLTVNTSQDFDSNAYLNKLYQSSAKWIYKDPYSDNPHLFESFWDHSDPLLVSRKCRHQNTMVDTPRESHDTISDTPLAPTMPNMQATIAAPAQTLSYSLPQLEDTVANPDFATLALHVATSPSNILGPQKPHITPSTAPTSLRPQYTYMDHSNYYKS